MANLQFQDLQNEVYAHTGLDSTDPTNQTNVNRWINYVQQDICARYPWTFMEGRNSIVTVPDYMTGTVSVTAGTNLIVGSGTTFTAAMAVGAQYFIQFPTSNDWYGISFFSNSTNLQMEQIYQGATSLVNSTYIIRKMYYSLPPTVDRIIDIRNWQTPLKIVQVDARTLDDIRPLAQSTNSSYGYLAWGIDTTGNIQISPYPFPSDSRLLEIRTNKRPIDMVAATDTPSIPNKYAHLLAWGALSVGFAFMRKVDLASSWGQTFEKRINEMRSEYRMSEDYQPVMRSIDSVQRSKWISLPDQYPVVTS